MMARKKKDAGNEAPTCPHPPDKDYTGVYFDPETGGERLWRGCTVCGAIYQDIPWPPWEKKKSKRKKKTEAVSE